jgi:hypothetical protein
VSRPTRARGLKLGTARSLRGALRSRPTGARGLKLGSICFRDLWLQSHTFAHAWNRWCWLFIGADARSVFWTLFAHQDRIWRKAGLRAKALAGVGSPALTKSYPLFERCARQNVTHPEVDSRIAGDGRNIIIHAEGVPDMCLFLKHRENTQSPLQANRESPRHCLARAKRQLPQSHSGLLLASTPRVISRECRRASVKALCTAPVPQPEGCGTPYCSIVAFFYQQLTGEVCGGLLMRHEHQ